MARLHPSPEKDAMSFLDRIKGAGRNPPDGGSAVAPAGAHTSEPVGDRGAAGDAPAPGALPGFRAWLRAPPQRRLLGLSLAGLAGLLLASLLAVMSAGHSARQVVAVGQATTQAQRLAKSASQAVLGNAAAFAELRESADLLARPLRQLASGGEELAAAPSSLQAQVTALLPLVDRAEKNAAVVLAQQPSLTQVAAALRAIQRHSGEWAESAENLGALKAQAGTSPADLAAVGRLLMLTQRLGQSAQAFLSPEGVGAETVVQLRQDLDVFSATAQRVIAGIPAEPAPPMSPQTMLAPFERTHEQARLVLSHLEGLVAAREAQLAIVAESEPLRRALDTLQQGLAGSGGFGGWRLLLGLLALCALAAGGSGLVRQLVIDQTARARAAELQRLQAERREQEARRVNEANQAAAVRLLHELQSVVGGDLTQPLTAADDLTGAIAASVNRTVAALRARLAQLQAAVDRVVDTTAEVHTRSIELQGACTEQLRGLRDTGEAVAQMAVRIHAVSAQAQETAVVARQSLQIAGQGLAAANHAIGGMGFIRDQIHETSKRVGRLGDSTQEISDIAALLSDLSGQIHVQALNAAVQAAHAGDAGRGFGVVAESMQQLAERAVDATRQIAAIVAIIQIDTQDAVGAMARSTQSAAQGARLSDATGAALSDMDRMTRELADLIERIAEAALTQAGQAEAVDVNIQRIVALTGQTADGAHATARRMRELSRTAEDLKATLAGLKRA
jgi:twitching motility protein PilJ